MDELIELVADLVDALEQRDSADPDSGSWQADVEVRRLERRLVAEFRAAEPQRAIDAPRPRILVATH